jgi:hypothetical protein
MSGVVLNEAGLLLAIIGGLIIFRWGPPQPSFPDYQALALGLGTPLPDGRTAGVVAERERLQRHYQLMARLDLGLIIAGFALRWCRACHGRVGGTGRHDPHGWRCMTPSAGTPDGIRGCAGQRMARPRASAILRDAAPAAARLCDTAASVIRAHACGRTVRNPSARTRARRRRIGSTRSSAVSRPFRGRGHGTNRPAATF